MRGKKLTRCDDCGVDSDKKIILVYRGCRKCQNCAAMEAMMSMDEMKIVKVDSLDLGTVNRGIKQD